MEWKAALPGSIGHRTAKGWFIWVDGRPPLVAFSEKNLLAETGKASVFASALAEDHVSPQSSLVVTLDLRRRRPLCPVEHVLALVEWDCTHKIELRFVGEEPLTRWDVLEAWLRTLEKRVSNARPNVPLTYVLDTGLPVLPAAYADFAWSSDAEAVLQVTDYGRDADDSLERSARVSDHGLIVRPRLCLTRENAINWERYAEQYRVACHGTAVSFMRPLPDAHGRLPDVSSFPTGEAVAELLSFIYESGRHDLSHCYPFSDILRSLAHGTTANSECMADGGSFPHWRGRVTSSTHGAASMEAKEGEEHPCAWAPLCRALGAASPFLRARNDAGLLARWERFYCPTLGVLMPRMIDQLAEAVQFQHALRTRPADERFRIAVHDGKSSVWTEAVTEPAGA